MNTDDKCLILSELKGLIFLPPLDSFVISEFNRKSPEFRSLETILPALESNDDLIGHLLDLNDSIMRIREFIGLQNYHYLQLATTLSKMIESSNQRTNEF